MAAKERPILFSAPMVNAILAGRKTQTRRIVKGLDGLTQPVVLNEETGEWGWWWTEWRWEGSGLDARHIPYDEHFRAIRCPYGVPGDRLWVRETFSGLWEYDEAKLSPNGWYETDPIWYWADGNPTAGDWTRPKPSIHMPRWASRIALEITEVRVERLQDISEEDADAEGFGGDFPDNVMPEVFPRREGGWGHLSIPECYGRLWEHINGAGSWDANPWVWAVSFRRVEQQARAA